MLEVKIFDKNFKPNNSSLDIPKYIKWNFVSEDDINENDVVVYTDQFLHIAKKHNVRRKIAWIIEPPAIHKYPYTYISEHHDEFDYILLFINEYKNIVNALYLPNIMFRICEKERKIYDKTKMVSLIFSNKSRTKNHKFRLDVVNCLKNCSVDMYGNMVEKYVENKNDTLKDYMFHIVIENCNNDGYYSEKTLDCFATGTIPIIYKSSCLVNEYDENGMIFFKSLKELLKIINSLSTELYYSKINSIKHNYGLVNKCVCMEDYLYEKFKYILE